MRRLTLLWGCFTLLITGVLLLVRSTPPQSPFIEFTSLRHDGWRYCRLYKGQQVVDCLPDEGSGRARVWSPDGLWGAFVKYHPEDNAWYIYVQGVNNRILYNLTAETGLALPGTPTWSPDGEWLVFSGIKGNSRELYKIRRDGSDLTQLTTMSSSDWMPSWSPDSEKLAFVSEWVGTFVNLYVLDFASGKYNQPHVGLQRAYHPVWSPDSRWLLVETDSAPLGKQDLSVPRNFDLFLLNLDSSQFIQLTHSPGDDFAASWSPDGQWIVYNTEVEDGTIGWELYRMHTDGSHRQLLLDSSQNALYPIWSPVINLPWSYWLNVIGALAGLGIALQRRRLA